VSYYRTVAREAWIETLDFAKRRGILIGPLAVVLGGVIVGLITRGLNWQPFASAAAGPNLRVCKPRLGISNQRKGAPRGTDATNRV